MKDNEGKKHSGAYIGFLSGIAVLVVVAFSAVVYIINPENRGFYPSCLFHDITGFYCPGCGTLRAFHQLLHGNVRAALSYNSLFVVSIPFIALFVALYRKSSNGKLIKSRSSAWIMVAIVAVYWIIRNIPVYPFHFLAP